MKKLSYLLTILFLLCCCVCSNTVNYEGSIKTANPPVDTAIFSAICELKEITTLKETNNIPIDSLIIAVRFDCDETRKILWGTDSVCHISFYVDRIDYSKYSFKGIINIESSSIAIFDITDVGKRFYNTFELKRVNIKELYRPHVDLAFIATYKIKGDTLIRWIGP